MTMAPLTESARLDRIEEKLDALTVEIGLLAGAAAEDRARRARLDELVADAAPVAREAYVQLAAGLDALGREVDAAQLTELARELAVSAPALTRTLRTLRAAAELADDLAPLSGEVTETTTDVLAIAQDRGYFEFARAAGGVVDRIVTGLDPADVTRLGDNVVTILDTVKDLTQPEILLIVRRMLDALERQQKAIEEEPAEPPSMWTLLRKMRDPDVRRGIARALDTLGTISAETSSETIRTIHQHTEKGT